MSSADALKSFRKKEYGSKPAAAMPAMEDATAPVAQQSRIISLTDDEKQAFGETDPGTEVTCEVRGTIEDDGLHVTSVAAPGGSSDESAMADEVMKRVIPNTQPSPS